MADARSPEEALYDWANRSGPSGPMSLAVGLNVSAVLPALRAGGYKVVRREQHVADGSDLVPLRLVPVQVFGAADCCEHGMGADCESTGYGLSDAVSAWSDCNRARGHIYRVDDMDPRFRADGETVEIWVPRDRVAFFEKLWGNTS